MIFDVNKFLNNRLTNHNFKINIKDRVFPLVAENSTIYPFVVYTRQQTEFNTISKDNLNDISLFDISIVTDKYSDATSISNEVFDLFNNTQNTTFNIDWIQVTNITESYENNAFVFTITVMITHTNN